MYVVVAISLKPKVFAFAVVNFVPTCTVHCIYMYVLHNVTIHHKEAWNLANHKVMEDKKWVTFFIMEWSNTCDLNQQFGTWTLCRRWPQCGPLIYFVFIDDLLNGDCIALLVLTMLGGVFVYLLFVFLGGCFFLNMWFLFDLFLFFGFFFFLNMWFLFDLLYVLIFVNKNTALGTETCGW